jgi:hypothetical protein
MAFPPGNPRVVSMLTLLNEARNVLGTYEMLRREGGEVKLNTAPLKPYGSERQHFRGDGRPVASNTVCVIRLVGPRAAAMTALLQQLRESAHAQFDDYSMRLAGVGGIRSWAPLGLNDTRMEIELFSGPAFFQDDALRFISGELWEFRSPP